MSQDANAPGQKRSDAWIGLAIAIAIALLIAVLIWCYARHHQDDGLGACSGRRVPASGAIDYWRPADPRQKPDCLYVAGQVIAEYLTNGELAAFDDLGLEVNTTARSGSDGEVVDDVIEAVGPYPRLALYTFKRADVDPLVVARRIVKETNHLATPNFLLVSSPIWRYGPAGAPSSKTGTIAALPPGAPPAAPAPWPTVVVVDSGYGDLKRVPNGIPMDRVATDSPSLGDASGHGTYIASRVSGATASTKVPIRVVTVGGATKLLQLLPLPNGPTTTIDDWQYANAVLNGTLSQAPATDGRAVLNLSFGSYGCGTGVSNRTGVAVGEGGKFIYSATSTVCATAGIRSALLYLKTKGNIGYVTAAAGNDRSPDRFYPAAFSEDACFHMATPTANCTGTVPAKQADTWLFAVGTTGLVDGKEYSNTGTFINVLARGTDVIGELPDTQAIPGTATNPPVPSYSAGFYKWSGTSFAAPCVASYIAVNQSSKVLAAMKSGALLEC